MPPKRNVSSPGSESVQTLENLEIAFVTPTEGYTHHPVPTPMPAKSDATSAMVALMAMDTALVLLFTGMAAFFLGRTHDMVFYLDNLLTFFGMVLMFRLYDASSQYYTLGKLVPVGALMGLYQTLFFLQHRQPLSALMDVFGIGCLMLASASVVRHTLTRHFARPDISSFEYRMECILKRVMDIVLSVVALVVFSPFMTMVGMAISLYDRGPAVYTQRRIGLDEKPFVMFKFRSMRLHADQHPTYLDHQQKGYFKLDGDPRITGLGKMLRKTSVDELPQLWNVLQGNMSLVGPRPPIQTEYEMMDHFQRGKFRMKPGITGLWQITGRAISGKQCQQFALYDNQYIDEWCIAKDISIILTTIPLVLLQRGAG